MTTNVEFQNPLTFLVYSSEGGDLYAVPFDSEREAREFAERELGEETRYVLIVQKYVWGGMLESKIEYHT